MKILRELFKRFNRPNEMNKLFEKMQAAAFPSGKEQIHEEAEMLYAVLNGRVPVNDLEKIIVATKPLFYLNQQRQKGEVTRLNNSLFEKRSKSIKESDIELILNFYKNYFELSPTSFDKLSPSVLTHVNIHDRDGYFWGCVNLSNKDRSLKLTETGIRRIYQIILLGAVLGAHRNISEEDREIFTEITLLPKGKWTEVHYNRFAFLFAAWMKYFKCFDEGNSNANLLNKVSKMLQEFDIEFEEVAKNESVVSIFEKCFVNLNNIMQD